VPLNRPLDGPGTERRVESFLDEELIGAVAEINPQL